MAIEAIGAALNDGQNASGVQRSNLNQDEFIKLFLAQLQFQDPLEPINNREFLAQMAQFSSLEQARITNQNTENLVFMNSTTQAVGLLGKQVEVVGNAGSTVGVISTVEFTPSGPSLTVNAGNGQVLPNIRLSQVRLVRN